MKPRVMSFAPAIVMALGTLLLLSINRQKAVGLAGPLTRVPQTILGIPGVDRTISPEERAVAGMTDYLFREHRNPVDSSFAFSVYVGYYDRQTQGRTIHSPRNCLPGAGWEPTAVSDREIRIGQTSFTVRRYLLAKDTTRALVYYWYQGRGRISANEYAVKWELLRDAALTGRSEEALVRIVLPLRGSEATADSIATEVARTIVPEINKVLPDYPSRHLMVAAATR